MAGPFPTKTEQSNDYFNLVTPYINTRAAELSVSAPNLATLNDTYDNGGVPIAEQGLPKDHIVNLFLDYLECLLGDYFC